MQKARKSDSCLCFQGRSSVNLHSTKRAKSKIIYKILCDIACKLQRKQQARASRLGLSLFHRPFPPYSVCTEVCHSSEIGGVRKVDVAFDYEMNTVVGWIFDFRENLGDGQSPRTKMIGIFDEIKFALSMMICT